MTSVGKHGLSVHLLSISARRDAIKQLLATHSPDAARCCARKRDTLSPSRSRLPVNALLRTYLVRILLDRPFPFLTAATAAAVYQC